MNAQHILFREFLYLPCKQQNQELWWMVRSIFIPYINVSITDIFTVPDKLITVKRIIIMIEICIFAPERINFLCNYF